MSFVCVEAVWVVLGVGFKSGLLWSMWEPEAETAKL